jgi:hypothetical protein
MARKVGFDRPDTDRETEPKRSIADSYLDEFHAKNRTASTAKPDSKPKVKRNWFVLIFMLTWITFWSFGIIMALGVVLTGGFDLFMIIWLIAASFGWIVALSVIIKAYKGKLRPKEKPNT